MPTPGRLVSHRGFNIGHGFTLVIPTGAYVSWEGTRLDGTGIQPDIPADWSRDAVVHGIDLQAKAALTSLKSSASAAGSR